MDSIRICNFKNKDYVVGSLALKEGLSPHKFLNSSAEDVDYQVLSLTGLMIATQGTYSNLIVTTGFPFTTYQPYREGAERYLKGSHLVQFDMRTLGGKGIDKVSFTVPEVDIMTEVEGAIKYIRDGEIKDKSKFLLASLGYGTFEIALSNRNGLVYRTTHSSKGIIYAIKTLEEEIQKNYYTSLLTDQQLERAFQRGNMIIDRRSVDLLEIRDNALESYYFEVVSPAIRRNITDEDFNDMSKIYLVGGGAHYQKLVDLFKEEFNDILEVVVMKNPNLAASKGYCLRSMEMAKKIKGKLNDSGSFTCVGLDLGNNNTVVTINNDIG
jgi:hypothetical protein